VPVASSAGIVAWEGPGVDLGGSTARHVILYDGRLQGSAPIGRGVTTIHLDKTRSVFSAFPFISTLARLDDAQGLYILCHGYARTNQRGQICGDMGGMGLELGSEGVLHSNVARWSVIRGAVSTIVVYSCGAADTQPENTGTTADGKYLMGALALQTQATVYAADRIQWYTTGLGPRVHRELRARGILISRKRVERLMREKGLQGAQKRRLGLEQS
jgi:hypothetical protein